ncbi:MAG TPA: copper resistance CopC family protein [Acetobacteraceae bacterium]
MRLSAYRFGRRRAVGLGCSVLCASASLRPLPAAAHAIQIASQPPIGGSIAAGPIAVDLHYNSRIDRVRSRLTLIHPDHAQTTLAISPDGTPDEIRTSATLTPGDYTLRWQVLAIDGHITRGDIPFTVTGP